MSSRRDYYFPNTEPLAANEMRVIALGTGRPFVRRAQANTSWLVELGNGDKFVFDFGSGSQSNFTALEIPHQDITAYFATHLHADHVGDFAQVWIGSWAGGRIKPLVVYGPSGPEAKYGVEHFVRLQMESLAWASAKRCRSWEIVCCSAPSPAASAYRPWLSSCAAAYSLAAFTSMLGFGTERQPKARVISSFSKNFSSFQSPSNVVPGTAISANTGVDSFIREPGTLPRPATFHTSWGLPACRVSSEATRVR